MARAFIGLGSNLGDRLETLSRAVKALAATRGIRVEQLSTVLETVPCGGPPQGPFLNAAIELHTSLSPRALLHALQRIETRLGRRRSGERWAPRTIDLDILLFGKEEIQTDELTIPHPRMNERRFVLEPLAELTEDKPIKKNLENDRGGTLKRIDHLVAERRQQ